jgi:CHAT domain-containing protein
MVPQVELNGRLIKIPDGKLNYLPFETLVEPSGRSLVESHAVSYTSSGASLQAARDDILAPAPLAFLGIGAIGDAAWKTVDRKLLTAILRASPERGIFDENGSRQTPLPAGLDELLSGAKLAGTSAKLLLGEQATEAAFKHLQLDRYRVIHIVAHASIDAAYPDRSAIILSESKNSTEDGLLQAREIRRMRLNAELVAIPACDTAVGRLEGQAGVVSLMQAFLLAGSKSVLGTLWSVEDGATETVMSKFCFYLSRGPDKGALFNGPRSTFLSGIRMASLPFTGPAWSSVVIVSERFVFNCGSELACCVRSYCSRT